MTQVTLRVDAREAIGFLNTLADYAPQATAVALNRTAEWGTKIGRDRAPRHFAIREPQALRYAFPPIIPGKERATARRPWVAIEPQRIGKIFGPYEEGVPHGPDRLGRWPAIPSTGFLGLRRTRTTKIPRQLYPANIGLQPRRDPKGRVYYALGRGSIKKGLTPRRVTASGKVQLQGRFGTFQIEGRKGPVILQRTGPGAKDVRPLWYLRPVVRRPAVLGYFQAITDGANQRWEQEMTAAFQFYQRIAERRGL